MQNIFSLESSFYCPNNSVYFPSFITINTSFSFGYPIYEHVYFSDSSVSISCPSKLVIHIHSLYYGIQSNTSTFFTQQQTIVPSNCFFNNTFYEITQICEGKNFCFLKLWPEFFGDPCGPSYSKQLFIQYQCVDTQTLSIIQKCPLNTKVSSMCPSFKNSTLKFQLAICEPTSVLIQCPSPYVIQILCGFFGIDPFYRCSIGNYENAAFYCYFQGFFAKISSKCNNNPKCNLNRNDMDYYGDPCNGKSKMLVLQWQCILKNSFKSQLLSPIIPVNLSITINSSLPSKCSLSNFLNKNCESISLTPFNPFDLKYDLKSFNYSIFQMIICDGGQFFIQCPINLYIHIYAAYYGIQNKIKTSCLDYSIEIPEALYLSSSFNFVNETCEFQNSCSLTASIINTFYSIEGILNILYYFREISPFFLFKI